MSSIRKESPAVARAVTNRRRQRNNAAQSVSTTAGLLSSQAPSQAAPSILIDSSNPASQSTLPFIAPTTTTTTSTRTMIGSSDSTKRTTPNSDAGNGTGKISTASMSTFSSSRNALPESKYVPKQQPKSSPPFQQQRTGAKDPPASNERGVSRSSGTEEQTSATPANRFTTSALSRATTSRQSVVAAKTTETATSSAQSSVAAATGAACHAAVSTTSSVVPKPNTSRRDGIVNRTNSVDSNSQSAVNTVTKDAATLFGSTTKHELKRTLAVSTIKELPIARPNGNHQEQEIHRSSVLRQQRQHRTKSTGFEYLSEQDDLEYDSGDYNDAIVDDEDVVCDVESLQGNDLVDASCLTSGTFIFIRSASPLGMYLSIDDRDCSDNNVSGSTSKMAASLTGMGLGRDTEVFRLDAVAVAHDMINSDSDSARIQQPNDKPHVIHYGDAVTLSCPGALDRALGARLLTEQGNGKTLEQTRIVSHCQVGCFDPSVGLGQQWTILAAGNRKRPLWVGPAALKPHPPHRNGEHAAAMVRAGDSIVLRHCDTGGLLSLAVYDENMKHGGHEHDCSSMLTLVTDSYSTNGNSRHRQPHQNGSPQRTESLLTRLQQHDRMFPTQYETFQLIPTMSPPCPRWARHGLTFHSGSYLLTTDRNNDVMLLKNHTLDALTRHLSTKSDVSVQEQENLLMDEVIGSLTGLEGPHVRIHHTGNPSTDNLEFCLMDSSDVTFHLSLQRLVERILPLASAFVQVRMFIAGHSSESVFGSVMHAFCEALDGPLQNHVSTINIKLDQQFRRGAQLDQIETTTPAFLTMTKLFTMVQPAFHTMLVLQTACARVRDKKGGSLLNEISRLRNQSFAGDSSAQRLIDGLLDKASVPYMELLSSWLKTGTLDDPCSEFLVQRVQGEEAIAETSLEPGYNGDTWNEMYVIRKEHVLLMDFTSSDSTLQKVLRTGKYWNAVGAAGRFDETNIKQDGILELFFRMDSVTFLSFVDSMYEAASQALVRLILNEYNLFETMRTLKRYFLLDQGDFFVNFLDTAEEELSKRASQVSLGQIQHWLGMAIQLCETAGDRVFQVPGSRLEKPFASPLTPHLLKCGMASESLSEHLKSLHGQSSRRDSLDSLSNLQAYGASGRGLTGVEAFILGFPQIPFPTSLVVSPKAISAYQLLFRHLFIAKHIERRLVSVWRDQQVMKVFQSLHGAQKPSNFLRQRMLHFCQNLIYYMMFEVIEPNWLEMCQRVFGAYEEQTVDSIIDCHNEFMKRTLDGCLLTNYDFVRILTKLMTTCLRFADQMKYFVHVTRVHEDGRKIANQKRASAARNINAPATKKAIYKALVTTKEERQRLLQEQTQRVLNEVSDDSFRKSIARLEHAFSKNLSDFMQLLRSDMGDLYHSHRLNLLIRLDYNGYVTKSIDINTN